MAVAYALKSPDGSIVRGSVGNNAAHVMYLSGHFRAAFMKRPQIMAELRRIRRLGWRVVRLEESKWKS